MKNFSINNSNSAALPNGSAVVAASMRMCVMMMSMRMQSLDTRLHNFD